MRSSRWYFAIAVLSACGPSGPPKPAVQAPGAPSAPGPVAAAPAAPAPTAPAAKDPEAPTLRLPAVARPLKHTVELTIDPSIEDFAGTITSELDITAPTKVLWLNGSEIVVDEAAFAVGAERVAARAIYSGKDYVGLIPARELAVGHATLVAKYHGKMHRNDGDGIYTAKEGEEWYAFTQFESTDARQAFPTFDEPSYKAPWQLSIHTKKPLVALSNTAVESETDEPNGMKLVRFAETKPLPSYLVAFAVGPFDAVDAGKTRAGGAIRIIVPHGRGKDVAFPAQATKPLLDLLEDYFGMPYPYGKLDMVAVSVFNAGAMENPGLITWRQELVLTKPGELTVDKQKTYAEVAAHEMAHQWFGDYVTLAWWDDTWLNESFASWMAAKIVDQWKPQWDAPLKQAAQTSGVLGADSLDAARAIRQPIKSANDIVNAFDGITYQKGEAVLTMIERLVGRDVFQRAVRDYLAKHAWGNATYEDFVGAMTAAAGKDLHPVFDAFVLQSGVPLVSFELACDKGKAPALKIAQRRYAPTGSTIDPKRTWHVPVCVKWGAGAATGRDCTMVDGETAELALSAKSCPAWVMPNEAGLGYYRMLPKGDLLDHLLANAPKVLSVVERIRLISDVNGLVASGDVKKGVALDLVGSLSKDKSRYIVDASIGVVASINDMVPDALRPNYERFINKLYRTRAHELGWLAKKAEPDSARELRKSLLPLVADIGRDPELIKQATELAWKWLDAHDSVNAEIAQVALSVASRNGDQKLFDRLHADAKKSKDREERTRLVGAMGSFIDPKIINQALAIMLTDEFDIRESGGMLRGAFSEPKTREIGYQFITKHFDEIAGKLPAMYRPYLAFTAAALCDDARKPEVEAFFTPKIEKLDGGPRILAQALEALSLCSVGRKAEGPGVEAFLKRQ